MNAPLGPDSGEERGEAEPAAPQGASGTGLLFALLWGLYALLTLRFWWVCDDAFIAFRYARNWATGHGLRFNLGDGAPVEGYSDFGWIAACAGLESLNADMTLWPLVLSFACGSLLLWIVFRTLRDRLGLGRGAAFVAALFLACCPCFFLWSTGGLETVPYALALFLTFQRLILRRDGIEPISAGLAGLLLALLREEGIYWVLLLAGLAAVSRHLAVRREGARAWVRPLATYLVIVAAGYAVYWTSRYTYYGHPFSNTAAAKVGVTLATLERGLSYVVSNVLTVPSLAILLPGLIVALRPSRRVLGLPVAVMSTATVVYPIVVSGDFLPMGRLLVIGLPFHTLLFAWVLEDLAGSAWLRGRRSLLVGVGVVLAGLPAAWDLHLVPAVVRDRFHFRGADSKERRSEYAQWVRIKEGTTNLTQRGKALRGYVRPGDSIVTGAIGCVAYYSGVFVYDQNGLVTRSVAVRDTSGEPLRQPGHDKHVPETFFLDRQPTIFECRILSRERLEPAMREWSEQALARSYAPDFLRLPEEIASEGREFLLVLRRIADGVGWREAWAEAFAAAAALPRD